MRKIIFLITMNFILVQSTLLASNDTVSVITRINNCAQTLGFPNYQETKKLKLGLESLGAGLGPLLTLLYSERYYQRLHARTIKKYYKKAPEYMNVTESINFNIKFHEQVTRNQVFMKRCVPLQFIIGMHIGKRIGAVVAEGCYVVQDTLYALYAENPICRLMSLPRLQAQKLESEIAKNKAELARMNAAKK